MPEKDIQKMYSCKRKPDYVTFLAVVFFIMMVVFELYLIVFVPIQLKRQGALQAHVAKEETLALFDFLREDLYRTKLSGRLQHGERDLVKYVLDVYAYYLRDHQDHMTAEDVLLLSKSLDKYHFIRKAWEDDGKFHLKKEVIDSGEMLRGIEGKILQEQGEGKQ